MIKMFGDRRMELDPEDLRLVPDDVDIGWYSFWTIISVISNGWLLFSILYLVLFLIYSPAALLGIGIVFIFIGVLASIGSFIVKSFKLGRKIDINDEKILINAVEKKISNFLHVNIGHAYSKKALVKRLVEKAQHPYFKKYIKTNGEKALNRLVEEGIILTTQKDVETHYFVSPTDN